MPLPGNIKNKPQFIQEVIEPEVATPVEPQVLIETEAEGLDNMSKAELMELAQSKGIKTIAWWGRGRLIREINIASSGG